MPPRASFSSSFYFYPRPPRGGRHTAHAEHNVDGAISIHALREEGDGLPFVGPCRYGYFYPRPPRGGRHEPSRVSKLPLIISIHALREEGDL